MSALADRLRDVIRPSGRPAAPVPPGSARPAMEVAEALGGAWCDSAEHRHVVVDRTYVPGYRHGRMVLADSLPPADGIWPGFRLLAPGTGETPRPPRAEPESGGRLLFVDLETTGLAGGAGTYAFLVGCGWFAGGVFRTRQYFLADYTAERGLLEAVAAAAEASAAVVSYNGKSFDLPLIETRFLLHRLKTPFAGMPHVDMLHTARRLWRSDGDGAAGRTGCRLVELEEALYGYRREGDVPGFEIPSRYFHYVRSGDARPLEAVLEHNRFDILSLAMLTASATRLLDGGASAAGTAREALGLGRLYERSGMRAEALECFALAGGVARDEDPGTRLLPGDVETRAQGLRAYAVACRRLRRHEAAASAWRRLLELRGCPPPLAHEAFEALAVHHEHRLRDFDGASRFARRSLDLAVSRARQRSVEYRLARLARRRAPAIPAAPLFRP
jgi:tetratricopeptide (TPR) repeat protein